MSALTTRDALVKALHETAPAFPGCMHAGAVAPCERQADALLASGAVIDAATLVDDEALMKATSRDTRLAGWSGRNVRNCVRALADALSERDA